MENDEEIFCVSWFVGLTMTHTSIAHNFHGAVPRATLRQPQGKRVI
jgi:hypothetical protein